MKKIKLILFSILCFITLTGCENTVLVKEPSTNSYQKVNTTSKAESNQNIAPSIQLQKSYPEVISNFSTKIYDTSKGRMSNLKLAADKLSNTVIESGEVFSFNDNMGPYNKNKGYSKAKIFDAHGNVLKEYGGGICQISSTLYNAALNLNLEILERHNHSNKVQYIELGKDAAISYGHLDLKFKNILDYPITIQCKIENNKVNIDIMK